jgi:hypothetical protein
VKPAKTRSTTNSQKRSVQPPLVSTSGRGLEKTCARTTQSVVVLPSCRATAEPTCPSACGCCRGWWRERHGLRSCVSLSSLTLSHGLEFPNLRSRRMGGGQQSSSHQLICVTQTGTMRPSARKLKHIAVHTGKLRRPIQVIARCTARVCPCSTLMLTWSGRSVFVLNANISLRMSCHSPQARATSRSAAEHHEGYV